MSEELKLKLKEIRARLGLTQAAFAAKLGVSLDTLQKWEQNQRTPRGFALTALNAALDALK